MVKTQIKVRSERDAKCIASLRIKLNLFHIGKMPEELLGIALVL